MPSLNKVLLMGNLTRDPELRTFASGTAVCNFGMAINRNFTDREGNRREETTFVDVESFGKQAETISRYMKKGSGIFIEGRLKLDQWEKDGQKRSKLRITLENFQFVGGSDGAIGSGNGEASSAPSSKPDTDSPSAPPQDTTAPPPSNDTETQADNIEEDDVPF